MNASSATRSLLAVFVAFFVVALLPLKCADRANEDRQASAVAGHQPPASVIHDWSTNRVIYPDTLPPGQYSRLANDPRYVNQSRIRRAQRAAAFNQQAGGARFSASDRSGFGAQDREGSIAQIEAGRRQKIGDPPHLQVDWAVSLGGGGVHEGVSPAKFTYQVTSPSCTKDFVVFPIDVSPNSSNQANIVAFNQLYKGPDSSSPGICGTGVGDPEVYWAYAVGDGPIISSPVPSLGGTKIAFVEASKGGAVFHVLRFTAETGASVGSPAAIDTTISSDGGRDPLTCPADTSKSCDVAIHYSTSTNTHSFPYVDYANNVAWVGDDSGRLYRIRNVFTAPEYDPSIDSVLLSEGKKMTSPVYDSSAGRVIVSDGTLLYSVAPDDTDPLTNPVWTRNSFNPSVGNMTDGPILDIRPQDSRTLVWLFGSAPAIGQVKYNTPTFAFQTAYVTRSLGAAGGPVIRAGTLTAGIFSPTWGGQGFVLACGNDGSTQHLPEMYRFDVEGNGELKGTSNVKSGPVSSAAGRCSPLTYSNQVPYDNKAEEYVFVGYIADSADTSQIQQWLMSGSFNAQRARPNRTVAETGGTSAIIIDNLYNRDAPVNQGANIYFGTLGSNMAVKLTQNYLL